MHTNKVVMTPCPSLRRSIGHEYSNGKRLHKRYLERRDPVTMEFHEKSSRKRGEQRKVLNPKSQNLKVEQHLTVKQEGNKSSPRSNWVQLQRRL